VSIKKNQHIVPQFYLKRFCYDGKLWVFDKVSGKDWYQRPSDVAEKTHFYSFKRENGSVDASVEDILGIIESTTHGVFAKIDGRAGQGYRSRRTLGLFMSRKLTHDRARERAATPAS
jgi:hypothetical protein